MMISGSHGSTGHFQFIAVQGPDDGRDQITRRLARSHAVKNALESKRKLQQESNDNFRITTSRLKHSRPERRRERARNLTTSLFSLSAGVLDPFQTLAVDSSRLQALLGDYKARQGPEPVFSVAEELAFQNFRSVFRTGLVDPALVNAIMLSLAFAVTGGSIDRECLGYQGQAIGYIREKMSSLDEATSESTIGAILLLAGVEARLGMTREVQVHMGAVQGLLKICQTNGIYLTGGIKRAIFWQDLNSSILSGSHRIVDHTTFAELQWIRDPFSPNFFRLPPGFQSKSHLLTKEFIEILEDIHALNCIRDIPTLQKKGDVVLMERVNNHTASIQSRLVSLPKRSPMLDCSYLAAYLCSVMLCCKIWCELVIPSHISSQLLQELQRANNDPMWDAHPDLGLWLIFIGGGFSATGDVRTSYIALLRSNNVLRFGNMYKEWSKLHESLKQFIWSDYAFMPDVKAFWDEASK